MMRRLRIFYGFIMEAEARLVPHLSFTGLRKNCVENQEHCRQSNFVE